MKPINFLLALTVGSLIISCQSNSNSKQESTPVYSKEEIQTNGAEIAAHAQSVLLLNVQHAIKEGGPQNAVSFCNMEVSSLMDSLKRHHNCAISRATPKNRNPSNHLQSLADSNAWQQFLRADSLSPTLSAVLEERGSPVYYQPILIGMPTCLKCHGTPGEDIDALTLAAIDSLYPNDKARNYQMGELRGMWKIIF